MKSYAGFATYKSLEGFLETSRLWFDDIAIADDRYDVFTLLI